jgi:hypothetical protein
MQWNIIWQVEPNDLSLCLERDWFYELISLVPVSSVHVDYKEKPLLSITLPYSIICASCPNQTDVRDLISYLKSAPKPRVLYHMSDELVQVGRELYQHCELVIRNGSADFDLADDPRVLQVPLGYVSGLNNGSGVSPRSSDRKCSFAFLGTMKNDRETEMLPALDELPSPKIIRKTKSFAAATKYFGVFTTIIYKNAVFVPNPMGNWNPECFRLYDALEWGCIPLMKRYSISRYHAGYHDALFGRHPIPSFGEWRGAVDFARELLADRAALNNIQAEINGWWQGYKSKLKNTIASRLAELAI